MLGKYITIDSTQIPNPVSFSSDDETVENVFQTEAGTDVSAVVRFGKVKASATFQVSSFWRDKLRAFSQTTSKSVTIDGVTKTMRIRNFRADLVENSENVANTDGLWKVSLDFIEV